MNLAQLLQLLHPHAAPRSLGPIDLTTPLLGITEDSRRVAPGLVFIARPGLRADGRRFIPEALRAGAVAVVTDQPPEQAPADAPILLTPDPALLGAIMAEHLAGLPSAALALVGITGTNGKTTTATLIARAARAAGLSCGLIGTVEVDDGSHATPSAYTTPPAEQLSPMLARMRTQGCVAAAMEVSSHALDQHRTAGVRFAAGVYTNLTGDHLDYHGDMDRYAAAKARLFAQLEPDALAVVNAADPWCERVVGGCRARVLRCTPGGGRTPTEKLDAVVTFANVSAGGMDIQLDGPWGTLGARTTLIGAHNAMNLLQAVAICTEVLGIAPDDMAAIIPGLCAPTGRLEPVQGPADDIAVLIDFAHTDDALANCLRAAR
ncbi:UDP-N-acetylmuramoylalanyl-D-glutamate--2,6-diaminopimelate ligase, partial [hydrothermal vent metagenome]